MQQCVGGLLQLCTGVHNCLTVCTGHKFASALIITIATIIAVSMTYVQYILSSTCIHNNNMHYVCVFYIYNRYS